MELVAIDLFCGVGGLTRGLEMEGIDVRVGVDVDPSCRYPYEANNWARFVEGDVADLGRPILAKAWAGADMRLLAGCAPCQPFSTYTQAKAPETDRGGRWRLVQAFGSIVRDLRPELVTMENVPDLRKHQVYRDFVEVLAQENYTVSENVVECEVYGIPQKRRRLVLLASRLGPVDLVSPDQFGGRLRTVRETIGDLPPIRHGGRDPGDALHRASSLSPINLQRIRASRPGGSWHEWNDCLLVH